MEMIDVETVHSKRLLKIGVECLKHPWGVLLCLKDVI